jgi:hypothetical protein
MFPGETLERRCRLAQRASQQIPERDHHSACRRRVLADQGGDGVERIEQEVRVQLHAQRVELRGRQLPFQIRGPALLGLQVAPQARALKRCDQDDGNQEIAVHRVPNLQLQQSFP